MKQQTPPERGLWWRGIGYGLRRREADSHEAEERDRPRVLRAQDDARKRIAV